MRIILAVLGAIGVVAIVAVIALLTVVGFTPRPFDVGGESAVGMAQNSLGHQYKLDAANLSATWTFTSDADVVVSFETGEAAFNGQSLPTGCYTGTAHKGDVLRLDGATGVRFASPDSDASCQALP